MTYVQSASRGLGEWSFLSNGGNSVPSQLWAWITGTVAEASDDPPAVVAWRAGVTQRGDVALRWPFADGFHGELAERESNADDTGAVIGYNYYLAPLDVINADRARRNLDALAANVILPVASAGESVAQVITGVAVRGAVVVGAAALGVGFLLSLARGRR